MKLIVYQSKELKVEVDARVLNLFNSLVPKTIVINPYFQRILHGYVADCLITKGLAKEDYKLSATRDIYVLTYGEGLSLPEPYSVFEDAIAIVASDPDFLSHPKIIQEEVNSYYEGEDFYCEIFEEPLLGVNGFFTYVENKDVHVMLFAYEKEEF